MGWRFYGRRREIRDLHGFMDGTGGFKAIVLRGQRQIGKTELIRNFFATEQTDDDRPTIICHIGLADGNPSRFHEIMERSVHETCPEILDGYIALANPVNAFPDLVRHLLSRGCTVVLDEFQRIAEDGNWLPSMFQNVIDRVRSENYASGQLPRLIVMGSEQQKLMDMFLDPKAPLFERIKEQIHLRPWTFTDLAEVAKDQGWDTRPDRLLTLWTAFGGLPAHWERFAENPALADFSLSMDDTAWTDAFLAVEEAFRQMPEGDFATRMEIQLRPVDRLVLAWLAERPGGYRLGDLPEHLHQVLAAQARKEGQEGADGDLAQVALRHILEARLSGQHLGLVDRRNAVDDRNVQRWYIDDNHARFHLDVLEKVHDMVIGSGFPITPEEIADLRRERMADAEGQGLETLTFAGLKHLYGIEYPTRPTDPPERRRLTHGAWRQLPRAEVDILLRDDSADRLWGVFAKRPADRHRPAPDCRHVANWLLPLQETARNEPDRRWNGAMARLRTRPRGLLFVARSFGAKDIAALERRIGEAILSEPEVKAVSEWSVMDIADMLSGRGPRPIRAPRPSDRHDDGPEV